MHLSYRDRTGSGPERLEILHRFQHPLIALLAPNHGETKQDGDVVTPPGPWVDFLAAYPRLAKISWDILDTWPKSWDLSIRKNGSPSKDLRISLCREVSHRELFVKIPSLPPAVEISILSVAPVHKIDERR